MENKCYVIVFCVKRTGVFDSMSVCYYKTFEEARNFAEWLMEGEQDRFVYQIFTADPKRKRASTGNGVFVIMRVEANRKAHILPGLYHTEEEAETVRARLAKNDTVNRVFLVDFINLGPTEG